MTTGTLLPGFFDPATNSWRTGEPETTYSDQRLAVHRREALIDPEVYGTTETDYPTIVAIEQDGDEEAVFTFHGRFWDIFRDVFNIACQRVHMNNRAKGFWPNNTDVKGSLRLALYPETHGRNAGELLALMTSEESEALDAYRTGGLDKKDDKLPHRSGFLTEIGDSVIRAMDAFGGLMAEAGTIIVEKLTYNKDQRGHLHGKRF